MEHDGTTFNPHTPTLSAIMLRVTDSRQTDRRQYHANSRYTALWYDRLKMQEICTIQLFGVLAKRHVAFRTSLKTTKKESGGGEHLASGYTAGNTSHRDVIGD